MFSPQIPLALLLALAALPLVASTADPVASRIYVAPTGSDSANGKSPDSAFATLERARDEIRRLKSSGPLPAGGVIVELANGDYVRSTSFELGEQDSGKPGAPVVYRA